MKLVRLLRTICNATETLVLISASTAIRALNGGGKEGVLVGTPLQMVKTRCTPAEKEPLAHGKPDALCLRNISL